MPPSVNSAVRQRHKIMTDNLNELDELRQERVIESRELDRELEEKRRDLENFKNLREDLSKELIEIKHYQERIRKEYQGSIEVQKRLETEIEATRELLKDLEVRKESMVKDLENKVAEKQKELNRFKGTKKDFIQSLKNQKKELEVGILQASRQTLLLSEEMEKVVLKEELLKNDRLSLQKREKEVISQKTRQDATEGKISKLRGQAEDTLRKAEAKRREKEQELQKQLKLTKSLGNKEKILNLKIEAQDKREAPVRRREEDFVRREKKLLDDRATLQRVWSEMSKKYTNKGGNKE